MPAFKTSVSADDTNDQHCNDLNDSVMFKTKYTKCVGHSNKKMNYMFCSI